MSTLSSAELVRNQVFIEDLTAATSRETIEYLSTWNQVGELHQRFIRELAASYAEQLLGDEPCRMVFAAHPGLGKTTCLRFFLLNIIRFIRRGVMPENELRSVLVCSNQVTELEDHILFLKSQLGESIPELGLFHQKPDNREFQRRVPVIDEADVRRYPLLFATQNLIRRRGGNMHRHQHKHACKNFGTVTFTHQGVRLLCWDEEAVATKASHVNLEGLREFRRRYERSRYRNLDPFIEVVVDGVLAQAESGTRALEDGSTFNITVPKLDCWIADDTRSFLSSLHAAREYGENYIKQARQLANWQGGSAVIHFRTKTSSNEPAALVMDYVIEVPPVLDRAVITDASAATNKLIQLDNGLVHAAFMQLHGHELKRYDNVRLFVQTIPSGRTSFLDGDQISNSWMPVLSDAVPKIRRLSPAGHSLIITFKGAKTADRYIKQIRNLLSEEDQDQLHFTTYGKHRGENRWSHCTSVFLAGTFHRDESELSSLARSQTGRPLDDEAQPYTAKELVHSQTASDIQQALSRGVCREVMTVDGITQAKPMNAFVGLSKRELPDVVKHLRDCFPGIQIIDCASGDSLVEEALISMKSQVRKELIDYLSTSTDSKVKSSSIKTVLEEAISAPFSSALWSSVQKGVHIPGWKQRGHSWVRLH